MSEISNLEKFTESQIMLEKEEIKILDLKEKLHIWERRFENDDVEFMIGKAFVCFSRGEHRDHCYEKFKRCGFLWEWFGLGGNTKKDLLLDVFGVKKNCMFGFLMSRMIFCGIICQLGTRRD